MFNKTNNTTPDALDTVIETVLTDLNGTIPGTDQFGVMVDQLEKLHKIKTSKDDRVKLEVLLPVIANLVGIGMILSYEHAHPIASKALGFVLKSR